MQDLRGVVFDYGNTLVELGPEHTRRYDQALAGVLARLYGTVDLDRLHAIRDRNRMAPYAGDPPPYRENDIIEITTDLVRDLYGFTPSYEELDEILRVRFEAFLDIVKAADGTQEVLKRLRNRYALAVLSNYPHGDTIRASLEHQGLRGFFETIVISGDLGYVKPHPLPFQTVAENLRLQPEQILVVGDNWLADIQGAKRAGMWAALTTQWPASEVFARQPGDLEPDFVIKELRELEQYLP